METKKISKWDAAPKSIKNLRNYISESWVNYAAPPCCPTLDPSCQDSICESMMTLLGSVLDDYNELEAKYQGACGMISQYEEENRNLKSELDIKTDECDALISRVFKQDDEYTKLKAENKELRETRELLNKVNSKQCAEVDDLEADIRDLEVQVRVNKGIASLYECEIKQVIELAKSYGLIIYDDRKDAISDDVKNIGMCGHYYVLGGHNRDLLDRLLVALEDKGIRVEWNEAALKWNLYDKTNTTCESCKQHYEDELRIRCEKIDDKNKLIDELTHENRLLRFKTFMNKRYGIMGHVSSLKEKIETLEKENKDLKDTLNKDGEFGKNIGKRVADSIREGCDKGVYKLHPLTRIDIHVEETNNMPTTFDRHAIPSVSVIFNNTQTEMERDTAEHECEELEKKFKELVKENEDLRTTFALCERDANMARELCHTIAFNAERAKNKTPWFNE